MKNIIYILICISVVSCKKDGPISQLIDERDSVTGTYHGIIIESSWTGVVGPNFNHDTSNVIIILSKSGTNVLLTFNNRNYEFTFYNRKFVSTTSYHPPQLRISSDSLFFYHQPALGPYWTDCIVKKQS